MIRFSVNVPQEVFDAIDEQLLYLVGEAAPLDRLLAWNARLFDLIDSLAEMPGRFPITHAVTAAKGYQVRRANHGDYAIFYRVVDAEQKVEVIAFRHGRQRPWLDHGVR